MEELLEKYSFSTLNNLNEKNVGRIIGFLITRGCNYIEDLLEDYLDIFTIDYEDFVDKFERINKRYNNEYLNLALENMNLWEELFY